MKKMICVFVALALTSCDDGEIILENFNFDGIDVRACLPGAMEGNRSYVFYKLDNQNFESISIQLTTPIEIFDIDGTFDNFDLNANNRVEYRRYNAAPGTNYFCNDVPPAEPDVIDLLSSEAGRLIITTSNTALTSEAARTNTEPASLDTDGDGIPNYLEPFGQDTDGDGIPDKLDPDDDGDNVPTIDEGVVIIDGVISLTQSRDTDGDGIPDYLDNDDDGDGILTIQEDLNADLDPRNDTNGSIPNYLNPNVAIAASPAIESFIIHSYSRTALLTLRIENLILTREGQEIVFNEFNNFGTYVRPAYQVSLRPDFVEATPNNP